MAHDWGYSKHNGPETWAENFPAARGTHQSPIDIIPSEAHFDKSLQENPLVMTYDSHKVTGLDNNGHTWLVKASSGEGSSLKGGPLQNEFKLAQFHCHWGKSDDTGSEHTVNGKPYAAELHIVHYNTDNYSCFEDAAAQTDGLCVLGIFVKPGGEHPGLKVLTDQMTHVMHRGDHVDLKDGFDPACLLPENTKDYWTYPGSLTTPPCYQSVTWVVFKQPIEVSEEELEVLRSLFRYRCGSLGHEGDDFGGHLVENYRPPMPRNDRTVRASFECSDSDSD